jgi:hypothetical protein
MKNQLNLPFIDPLFLIKGKGRELTKKEADQVIKYLHDSVSINDKISFAFDQLIIKMERLISLIDRKKRPTLKNLGGSHGRNT